jgi:hypothetical protein
MTIANRNRLGTDRLVGPANTVILRSNLGGDPSLREVMRRVRATTLAASATRIFLSKSLSTLSSANEASSLWRCRKS